MKILQKLKKVQDLFENFIYKKAQSKNSEPLKSPPFVIHFKLFIGF
jgi:hypothetical protein